MSRVTSAVAAAWTACVPDRREPGGTFGEQGGDSLTVLRFVHELSTALGSELPLDVVGMDSTMQDVERAVLGYLLPPVAVQPRRPLLVLVSGAYGDEPGLADLRRGLCDVDVLLVEPPGIHACDRILRSIPLMASLVAQVAMQRRGHDGGDTVHLAGFSFGGSLALEVAHVLAAAGQEVASLSLIDPPLSSEAVRRDFWMTASPTRRVTWGMQTLPGRWRPARVAAAAVIGAMFSADGGYGIRRRMLHPTRSDALARWTPRPIALPTLVVLGEGLGERNAKGWSSLMPRAKVLRVGGGHGDMLKGDNLTTLVDALLSVMDVNHGAHASAQTSR